MKWFNLVFVSIWLIIINISFATASAWSEGNCSSYPPDGATRTYYNGAAYLKWENQTGDWVDASLINQGLEPFSLLTPEPNSSEILIADVTSIVNAWQQGTLDNQGFLLKKLSGSGKKIFSKEGKLGAKLILTFEHGSTTLDVLADTELSAKTYKCLGAKATISLKNHVALYFALDQINTKFLEAKLQVTMTKKSKNIPKVGVFAIKLPENHSKNSAVRKASPVNDLNYIYHASFEDEGWEEQWEIKNGAKLTDKDKRSVIDKKNKFEPLLNNALRVTIDKGKHVGISAKLPLNQVFPNDLARTQVIYFRYFLRFGDTWVTTIDGKLPGFSGTYNNKVYRGGWGGRPSNGNNGWSARGKFAQTTPNYNPLADRIPVGTYLYHSNMSSTYGESLYWDMTRDFVLKKNKWYAIEQKIKMNTIGNNDGELQSWIDGKLVYSETNLNFSNHPEVGVEAIWLNVYHGGKKTANKEITLYIDELTVSTNYIGFNIEE